MATSSELVTKPPTKDITKQYPYMRIDLTGKQFGHLTVLYRDGVIYGRKPAWVCRCDCPDKTIRRIASRDLRTGKTTSCGCVLRSWQKHYGDSNRTHGMTNTSEYKIWKSMRQRCYKESAKNYKNYGGRGIKVCERWMKSFDNFIEDMGRRPSPKHSIERVNNDGNYEPDNCIWIPIGDQNKNKRKRKPSMRVINADQVKEARETPYRWGLDESLANKFGVSRSTVRRWRTRSNII